MISLILLLLVGGVYWWDARVFREARAENAKMSQRIQESVLKQKEAIIQRRVSEQLEEIAQQQKLITESQRTIALRQRAIAEERRLEAVAQKHIADQAKTRAVEASKVAEEQKQIAIEQKQIAIEQKNAAETAEKKANRLRMLALGQSLSARSINQMNAGNDSLAAMLAMASWHFISENNGDLYQAELFQALKMSSGQDHSLRVHKGAIRDMDITGGFPAEPFRLATVSQSGELVLWEGDSLSLEGRSSGSPPLPLLDNEDHDFRKVAFNPSGNVLTVGDATGNIMVKKAPFNQSAYQIFELSDRPFRALSFISEHMLVYPEGSNVMGFDVSTGETKAVQIYHHTHEITAMIYDGTSGNIIFGDKIGGLYSFKPNSDKVAQRHFQLGTETISSLAGSLEGPLAMGTVSGNIFVQEDRDTSALHILTGHLSQVNDLAFCKGLLLSISYDMTLRLWNVKKNPVGSVVVEKLNAWGYCMNVVPGTERIISAGAGRLVRITTINPEKMAELVQQRINRNFTEDEWNTYIGSSIDYKLLKEE